MLVKFLILAIVTVFAVDMAGCLPDRYPDGMIIDDQGAVIRKDTAKRMIYPVFTGHDFDDGFQYVRDVLKDHRIKATFFFTGDFYRNTGQAELIRRLLEDGHYLGAHSDKHLLYCDWEKRDSLLVGYDVFKSDLENNYIEMKKFGISREETKWFMPPYEWYNDVISGWTREMGLILVNFTPGTRSNADYTYPEMGDRYVSSEKIMKSILTYEEKEGMNGFILLIHPGTDPRRTDKFYFHLDSLLNVLEERGYVFGRIDE